MKYTKKLAILFLVLLSMLSLSVTSYAHDAYSNMRHDPSYTKWDIYESGYTFPSGAAGITHSSGNGIYIRTDSSVGEATTYTNITASINSAIAAWKNAKFDNTKIFYSIINAVHGNYSLTTNDESNQKTLVTIKSVQDTDGNYWGKAMINSTTATYYAENNGGKHIKTCYIHLNESKLGATNASLKQTYQTYTVTHELGHVLGLADLSSDYNDESFENCLMGYSNYTMTAPAIPDMQGAAVISGVHTSHSLVEYGKYNSTYHRKHCEDCNAYKLYTHTYSGNVCTKCGYNKAIGS